MLNDVIDNDVTDNDVIDSWMNMHTLLASRPSVASTRRARCERAFRVPYPENVYCINHIHCEQKIVARSQHYRIQIVKQRRLRAAWSLITILMRVHL